MRVTSLLRNRNFAGLLLANTIFGAAFPIQLLLGGLAGSMLASSSALATLPSAIQTLAGLVAAAPISLFMGKSGRRTGFALGGLLTICGAVLGTLALVSHSFILLSVAHFLMGAGWASFQYFRFAAGEAVEQSWQPVAISLMLSSLLIAAIIGPQIFIVAQDALAPIPLAGAYVATGVIGLLGIIPLVVVRTPRVHRPQSRQLGARFKAWAALRRPAVRQAVGIAAVSQGVMVFLMIPTPIAMVGCGFSEVIASDVVRWHIVAMFAPSFFTGFLIKWFGTKRIAFLGLGISLASAAAAALGLSAVHFYGALIALGVGWNFGFIGGTAMLEDAISEDEKAAVQGANETIIALLSTISAFAAGFVLSSVGWTALAVTAAGLVALVSVFLFLDRTLVSKV